MLIGLAVILCLIFCGGRSSSLVPPFNQTEDLIKKNVQDDSRKKQALDTVDEMKKTFDASTDGRKKSIDSLQKLLDDRTTPPDQINSGLQSLIADDQTTSEKLLDSLFQLKNVITADEWTKVFPPPATQPSSEDSTPK
jgi:small-conductance mechanosensitive channel